MTQRVFDVWVRSMQARALLRGEPAGNRCDHDPSTQADQGLPFTDVTLKAADRLSGQAASSRFGLVIEGRWYRRRFVMTAVREAVSVVRKPAADLDRLTLVMAKTATAAAIARECQRFGARVERLFRDKHHGEFDVECGDVWRGPGGMRHIVHQYHHVALCQYKGPWPEESPDPEISSELEVCPTCCSIARERPSYRARYHPLSVKAHPMPPLA